MSATEPLARTANMSKGDQERSKEPGNDKSRNKMQWTWRLCALVSQSMWRGCQKSVRDPSKIVLEGLSEHTLKIRTEPFIMVEQSPTKDKLLWTELARASQQAKAGTKTAGGERIWVGIKFTAVTTHLA